MDTMNADSSKSSRLAGEVVNYYRSTRGVGHTHLLRKGLDQAPRALLLAGTYGSSQEITRGRKSITVVSVNDERFPERIRGARLPMAVDNFALGLLLSGVLEENDWLWQLNTELQHRVTELETAQANTTGEE